MAIHTAAFDRLGSSVTQHGVAGWLAGRLADGLGAGGLGPGRRLTDTHTLAALIWQLTSTATEARPALWRCLVGREGVGPSKSCEMVVLLLAVGQGICSFAPYGIKLRVSCW